VASNFIESTFKGDLDADLTKFAADIQDRVVMSGAAAMAKVMYDEAQANCPVSAEAHYFYGSSSKSTGQRYLFTPGNLKRSIYRAFSPEKSTQTAKTYRISWNHSDAPYGYMVEFGTVNAAAHPFMRPAFSKINEAISAGKARMALKLAEGA
jgi:HK97 gp10 family phage protein